MADSTAGLYSGNEEVLEWISGVKLAELKRVDFSAIVHTEDGYEVRPTIALSLSGEPMTKYGVFNTLTGVMEGESCQFVTAREWAKALSNALNQPSPDELPGLSLDFGGDDGGTAH